MLSGRAGPQTSVIERMKTRQDIHSWCFVSGRVAALEGELLSAETLTTLARTKDVDALLLALGETHYRELFLEPADIRNAERSLNRVWADELRETEKLCPQPAVVELFTVEVEFQNYKSYLKNRFFGLPCVRLAAGKYTEEEYSRLLEGLYSPLFELFGQGTARLKSELEGGRARPLTVDWVFDAISLGCFVAKGIEVGSELVAFATRRISQLRAAEVILRARAEADQKELESLDRLFIPALTPELGELGSKILHARGEEVIDVLSAILTPNQIERLAGAQDREERDEALSREVSRLAFDLAQPAGMVTFGPEKVCTYLLLLRTELRNLKVICVGKTCHIEPDMLMQRIIVAV